MKRHPEVNDINQEVQYTDEEEEEDKQEESFSGGLPKPRTGSESEESYKDTSEVSEVVKSKSESEGLTKE